MIKIPPETNVVTDQRLTLIRILSTLTAKAGRLDTMKGAVKASLKSKGATFAQSELVIARLSSGGERSFVDPRKLYDLVKAKRITHAEFLGVICVRSSLLPPILSGTEIEEISAPDAAGEGQGSLYTEFKSQVSVNFAAIEEAIVTSALSSLA
jgi:hypothetical protein